MHHADSDRPAAFANELSAIEIECRHPFVFYWPSRPSQVVSGALLVSDLHEPRYCLRWNELASPAHYIEHIVNTVKVFEDHPASQSQFEEFIRSVSDFCLVWTEKAPCHFYPGRIAQWMHKYPNAKRMFVIVPINTLADNESQPNFDFRAWMTKQISHIPNLSWNLVSGVVPESAQARAASQQWISMCIYSTPEEFVAHFIVGLYF